MYLIEYTIFLSSPSETKFSMNTFLNFKKSASIASLHFQLCRIFISKHKENTVTRKYFTETTTMEKLRKVFWYTSYFSFPI